MNALSLIICLLIVQVSRTKGDNCKDLNGAWYNELGSEMIVTHSENGELVGEYRTAVERNPGAAGDSFSKVTGGAEYGVDGTVIGFAVLYRDGGSTAAFLGQCLMCEGQEVIMSSWMLRIKVDSCTDKWKSVHIGRNYFTREEQRFGPRKRFGTHTPQGYNVNGRKKRSTSWEDYIENLRDDDRMKRNTGENIITSKCTFNGDWFNERGSKVALSNANDRKISGSYQTPKERQRGTASGKHGHVFGTANPEDPDSTGAFFLNWNKGDSITAWAGQCHKCGEGDNVTEVLETAWLHRAKVETCNQEWKSTLYGENSFYRDDEITVEESAGVVGEFGEEETLSSGLCTSSAPTTTVAFSVVMLLSLFIYTIYTGF